MTTILQASSIHSYSIVFGVKWCMLNMVTCLLGRLAILLMVVGHRHYFCGECISFISIFFFLMSDGFSINIFYRNQIFDMSLSFKPTFVNIECVNEFSIVSSLISDQKWDSSKLHQLFVPMIAYMILRVDLLDVLEDDKWVWISDVKGQSSTRHIYAF